MQLHLYRLLPWHADESSVFGVLAKRERQLRNRNTMLVRAVGVCGHALLSHIASQAISGRIANWGVGEGCGICTQTQDLFVTGSVTTSSSYTFIVYTIAYAHSTAHGVLCGAGQRPALLCLLLCLLNPEL